MSVAQRAGRPPARVAVTQPAPDPWRTFAAGARLGWAIESNWSDPLLFAIYSVAKPLGATLVLVAMVIVVTGGRQPETLAFMVVGSALWNFVGGGLIGLVQSILDDRERYKTLKYVYIAPASLFPFLLGRSVARVAISVLGAIVTLAVGIAFLGVHFDLGSVRPAMLVVSMAVGLVAIGAFGIGMAGVCLQLRQDSWSYPEALAGALYLLAGAIFPIDVLPGPIQSVSLALPITWWLEGARRGLLGTGAPGRLATFTDLQVLGLVLATTAVFTLASWVVFRSSERRARDRGLIDTITGS